MIFGMRAGADGSLTLATGAADQTVIVWRVQLHKPEEPWQFIARLQVLHRSQRAAGCLCCLPVPSPMPSCWRMCSYYSA